MLAGVVAPKLWRAGADEAAFHQGLLSALRYAQSTAVAKQRTVCAAFTTTTVTLTYDPVYGASGCGATPLPGPTGAPGAYQVSAQGSASLSAPPGTLRFDRLGRPDPAGVVLTLNDGRQIVVEAESGYVH